MVAHGRRGRAVLPSVRPPPRHPRRGRTVSRLALRPPRLPVHSPTRARYVTIGLACRMPFVAEWFKFAGPSWVFVLGVSVASRLFYLLVGFALVGVVPPEPFHRLTVDNPFGTLNL